MLGCVGDGTRLRPALAEEELALFRRSHVHQQDGREGAAFDPLAELCHVAPAERSAEVPQEGDELRCFAEHVAERRAGEIASLHGSCEELVRKGVHESPV